VRQRSPGGVDSSTAPNSAQIVQVETLGRTGLVVMLVMFGVIVAVGILAGYALGAGEERDESVDTRLQQMNSRVSVVEYDLSKICGALLAKEVVEACH
jgi:hypothetical protein